MYSVNVAKWANHPFQYEAIMELDKYSTVVGTAKSAEQRWFTELTVPSKPREMVLGTQRG